MILIIDMGYLMFYRLHATTRWMSFQNEYKNQDLDDDVVIGFYEKHLRSQLDKLKKKYKCPILFCKDAKHADVWRKEHYAEYKATRGSPTPLIRLAQEVMANVLPSYGTILAGEKLEADDVAYLTVKHIRATKPPTYPVTILTSDRDYLQMKDEFITIIDGGGKEMKGCGDPKKDKLIKILMGDSSDNIPPVCKGCGKKTAETLANDPVALEDYLVKNNAHEAFTNNQRLICMDQLPTTLVEPFYSTNKSIIENIL